MVVDEARGCVPGGLVPGGMIVLPLLELGVGQRLEPEGVDEAQGVVVAVAVRVQEGRLSRNAGKPVGRQKHPSRGIVDPVPQPEETPDLQLTAIAEGWLSCLAVCPPNVGGRPWRTQPVGVQPLDTSRAGCAQRFPTTDDLGGTELADLGRERRWVPRDRGVPDSHKLTKRIAGQGGDRGPRLRQYFDLGQRAQSIPVEAAGLTRGAFCESAATTVVLESDSLLIGLELRQLMCRVVGEPAGTGGAIFRHHAPGRVVVPGRRAAGRACLHQLTGRVVAEPLYQLARGCL